jgi:hypothetical protein
MKLTRKELRGLLIAPQELKELTGFSIEDTQLQLKTTFPKPIINDVYSIDEVMSWLNENKINTELTKKVKGVLQKKKTLIK